MGAAPKRTYMSASPVPPEIWNDRLVAPAGTASVQVCVLPEAPEMPVTGTPLVSTEPPPVQAAVVAEAWAELAEEQVPFEAETT